MVMRNELQIHEKTTDANEATDVILALIEFTK